MEKATGNEKGMLGGLAVRNVKTGELKELPVSGLFFAIGHEPASKFLNGQVGRPCLHTIASSAAPSSSSPSARLNSQRSVPRPHTEPSEGCMRGRLGLSGILWALQKAALAGARAHKGGLSRLQLCGGSRKQVWADAQVATDPDRYIVTSPSF